jgi:hypothetical protein
MERTIMKKLLLFLMITCAFTFAQPNPAPKDKAAAKEKTVTGCIHKEGDNTWLKTRTTSYHVMSKDDLTAHDGHEVKVTGTASKGPIPGSSKQGNHLEASKVEMVSDKCAMGTKKAPKQK